MGNALVHVVFDLDDTLYVECTYTQSAFEFLGQLVAQAFGCQDAAKDMMRFRTAGDASPVQTYWSERCLPISALSDCLSAMRAHWPDIAPRDGAHELLHTLDEQRIGWSILTDGRSITQRQKIAALGLIERARGIYISEERGVTKPDSSAYLQIERDFVSAEKFIYVADNPAKDFVAPNRLGWTTIMVRDNGQHIHRQDEDLPSSMQAAFVIDSISQALKHIGSV